MFDVAKFQNEIGPLRDHIRQVELTCIQAGVVGNWNVQRDNSEHAQLNVLGNAEYKLREVTTVICQYAASTTKPLYMLQKELSAGPAICPCAVNVFPSIPDFPDVVRTKCVSCHRNAVLVERSDVAA